MPAQRGGKLEPIHLRSHEVTFEPKPHVEKPEIEDCEETNLGLESSNKHALEDYIGVGLYKKDNYVMLL